MCLLFLNWCRECFAVCVVFYFFFFGLAAATPSWCEAVAPAICIIYDVHRGVSEETGWPLQLPTGKRGYNSYWQTHEGVGKSHTCWLLQNPVCVMQGVLYTLAESTRLLVQLTVRNRSPSRTASLALKHTQTDLPAQGLSDTCKHTPTLTHTHIHTHNHINKHIHTYRRCWSVPGLSHTLGHIHTHMTTPTPTPIIPH